MIEISMFLLTFQSNIEFFTQSLKHFPTTYSSLGKFPLLDLHALGSID